MPLKVVHGGQVTVPGGSKNVLAAVSQTTGVLVIADPDKQCIYSVSTADMIRSVPDAPRFEALQVQNMVSLTAIALLNSNLIFIKRCTASGALKYHLTVGLLQFVDCDRRFFLLLVLMLRSQ